MTEVVKVCYRFLWKRWSQSPERFTTALKPRRSFSPGFQKEQQQKASAKIPQKPCEMDKMASWIIMIYLFIRPMPPDRLVVVDSETQEIAWRRSQVDHFDRKKIFMKFTNVPRAREWRSTSSKSRRKMSGVSNILWRTWITKMKTSSSQFRSLSRSFFLDISTLPNKQLLGWRGVLDDVLRPYLNHHHDNISLYLIINNRNNDSPMTRTGLSTGWMCTALQNTKAWSWRVNLAMLRSK